LDILYKEMDVTMALCGKRQVAELDRSILAT
jgi:isopentenyl diphosphate isomerase/L-lactate dehydrogenase-like FMN-dependent dehydrogenase